MKQLRTGSQQLLDPPSLDAGIYDDCLAILTRHPEAIEDTFVFDVLSVLRFAPAIKIIGRTIGKIFDGLYTVFTEGDEHLLASVDETDQRCLIVREGATATGAVACLDTSSARLAALVGY